MARAWQPSSTRGRGASSTSATWQRATCRRLARDAEICGQQGMLATVDLGPSAALDELEAELQKLGVDALPIYGDMGSTDDPARVVEEAVQRFGGLDGVVSNAGINR